MLFDFKPPIAVLDSGVGGLKLAKCLNIIYPNENIIYFADKVYMPYGKKTKKTLIKRLDYITDFLINNFNIKMLVLACNTASVVGLEHLKSKYKITVFGVSPNTLNADLTICTTLTQNACNHKNFVGLKGFASKIEEGYFNKEELTKSILKIGKKYHFDSLKSVVLGCTHYELVQPIFVKCYPKTNFICPTHKTINDITNSKLLENENNLKGKVYMMSSLPSKDYIDNLYNIFNDLNVPTFFT